MMRAIAAASSRRIRSCAAGENDSHIPSIRPAPPHRKGKLTRRRLQSAHGVHLHELLALLGRRAYVPLPASPARWRSSNRRSRRTPSTDNSAAAGGSLRRSARARRRTSTVPGVPSGKRTIRHGAPPTRRRPSTASRSPAQRMLSGGDRHLPRQRRAQLMQSVMLVRAGPQDRRQGRGVALPAGRGRAVARELRAAQADPRCELDPLSQGADQGARQREANRLHKVLEDTGIKLDCVASDILGVSGRAMLDALCQGTTDPRCSRTWRKGKLRKKIPALRRRSRVASTASTR